MQTQHEGAPTLLCGALEERQRGPQLEVGDRGSAKLRDAVVGVEQLLQSRIAQDEPSRVVGSLLT